ncbi:MAG: hypothetical protein Q9217_000920 [Psora testacea]
MAKDSSQDWRDRRPIRSAAIASAACGLFLNTITTIYMLVLSIVWNNADRVLSSTPKHQIPAALRALLDTILFLAFLAVAITNGITTNDIGTSDWVQTDMVILLAYNSVPWLICAGLHLLLVLRMLAPTPNVTGMLSKMLGLRATCSVCNKHLGSGSDKSDQSAYRSLLQEGDDEEGDEEESRSGRGAIRLPGDA